MSRIGTLAINDEGFAFDPQTGDSFTLNKTALCILKSLKEKKTLMEILITLKEMFETPSDEELEKDYCDFVEHLKICQLIWGVAWEN